MSKDKKKPKVPYTHQLKSAQEDLLRHRTEMSAQASQVKERLRERLSSKGMLGFAAGTGFLLGEMTRPAPVVVAASDSTKSKRQQKRELAEAEKAKKSEKKENSKSGLQTLDELIKTTMHLMAWVRTFEALANRPVKSNNQEIAPEPAQDESAGSMSTH